MGKRQAPVALLADHPVAHVVQPVQLAVEGPTGEPADLPRDVLDLVPPRHVDVPLVHVAEQQRRLAPPAMRIAVRVWLLLVVVALPAQVLEDGVGHVAGELAAQHAEAFHEHARLVDGGDDGQAQLLAQVEVLLAAAGRHVDDAGPLVLGDDVPRDDAVRGDGFRSRGQVVERAVVAPALHGGAGQFLDHLERPARLQLVHARLHQVVGVAVLHGLHVGEFRVDGAGDVGGERPGRGGPDQQILTLAPAQGHPHEDGLVGDLFVALVHLLLADAGAAARAPRHAVAALVE